MTNLKTEVLIVGAGPVGLTLANELHKWGINFRIVDSKNKPETNSRASNLWPKTQEGLATLGLSNTFIENSLVFERFVFFAYGKQVGVQNLKGYPSPYSKPLQTGQNKIEKILWDNLTKNGITVEGNKTLVSTKEINGVITTVIKGNYSVPNLAIRDKAFKTF